MRYALYFTPPADDPLTRAAAEWLGRDAFLGRTSRQPAVNGLSADQFAALTSAARRYGFHATLKAPFRLAEGMDEAALLAAVERFAASTRPFDVALRVGQLGGFFALLPAEESAALQAFAGAVVEAFDAFRAPLSAEDRARRTPEVRDAQERAHLERWGYPYVFDRFRFHMTLTGRAGDEQAAILRPALEARFASLLDAPVRIGHLGLFVEPAPEADFVARALVPLTGPAP
jgi:putative phosphonate metabolism protein